MSYKSINACGHEASQAHTAGVHNRVVGWKVANLKPDIRLVGGRGVVDAGREIIILSISMFSSGSG